MTSRLIMLALVSIAFLLSAPGSALAQEPASKEQIKKLERRIKKLESKQRLVERKQRTLGDEIKDASSNGVVMFLFGIFCALWAQNTGRNPWLWFFFGAIFSVIAVLVLLDKNARDIRAEKVPYKGG